ncbi:MAG: GNAT family N-acetyltransferase, partial [Ruminococcus sp.]
NGEWFMEVENFRELDRKVMEYGYRIGQAHPFYIATEYSEADTKGLEIRKFLAEEIEQFRDDDRFGEAFIFAGLPRDEIGIGAYQYGKILGMAGATSDSPLMWQIGINVLPEAKGLGIGTMLVKLLKNEILSLGKLPFYGTAVSHIASQRVALNAGFVPAWSELYCEKNCDN